MKNITSLSIFIMLIFAACGPGNNKEGKSEIPSATPSATEKAIIRLNAGDDMRFDRNEIRVKEGRIVKITLTHIGKLPKEAMGHNFVLLASGVSLEDFAREALNAKDNEYVPVQSTDVLVHTKLLGGGESDTIEFTAPAKGTYDFLCTFPGHWGLMKGKFIVE